MDDSQAQSITRHSRRRRTLVCEPCRMSKLRCDRNQPCSNCLRSKTKSCSYLHPPAQQRSGPTEMPPSRAGRSVSTVQLDLSDRLTTPVAQALEPSSPAVATADPTDSAGPRDIVKTRNRASATQGTWHSSSNLGSVFIGGLSDNGTGVPSHSGEASGLGKPAGGSVGDQHMRSSTLGDLKPTDGVTDYVAAMQKSPCPINCIMVKDRYVGQTHWLHSAVLFPNAIHWLDEQEQRDTPCWKLMQDCRSLAKLIELRRSPQPWTGVLRTFLPARALADLLTGSYLRTFETIYRVFHLPTFKDDYESLWTSPTATNSVTTIKVQLCMALGASLHDDQFSLRKDAMQWIHQANAWLASSEQSRFSISGLQIMCLLQQARMITEPLIGDLVWVSGGMLSRTAISMGLHIDPSTLPKMSFLRAEMRRRLWTTIVELELEASVEAGVLPQVASQGYNSQLPANLNDSDLSPDIDTGPGPAPSGTSTDMSLQIELGRSLKTRLAIVNFSNQPPASPRIYEQVLKLSSELTACCRYLARSLNSLGPSASVFQRRLCELIVQRYFLILHLPYVSLTAAQPIYHFSRKQCVDTALDILYAVFEPSSIGDSILASFPAASNTVPKSEELQRLMICSSGPLRSILQQCVSSIASELLAVIQELLPAPSPPSSTTLSPPVPGMFPAARSRSLRTVELHLILRCSVEWMEKRILAGQTNVKDYLFYVLILAEAEALMGASLPEDSRRQKALEALEHSVAMLRDMEGSDTNSFHSSIQSEELDAINDFCINGYFELGYEDLASIVPP